MKKRILKGLLAAAVFGVSLNFGAGNYIYASEMQNETSSEETIFKDEDSLEEYLNRQLMNHNTMIRFNVYQDLFDDIFAILRNTDCYCELAADCNIWYYIDGDVYSCEIEASYRTTPEQDVELNNMITETLAELELEGKTEYQKVKIIHDYICDNVDYDYEHLELGNDYPMMYTAYAAVTEGKAVCQGYAELFYRMGTEAGLSVKVVTGYGNAERHAWNLVRIGNEYYNIDLTWNGQDAETYYDFFLKTDGDFDGHIRDSIFQTSEYYSTYVMADSSWIDFEAFKAVAGLNLDNIELVKHETLDGKLVTNQPEGRPKILVFGNAVECSYSYRTAANLAQGDFDDIDIIFVDCAQKTADELREFEETYIKGAIPVAYVEDYLNLYELWDYMDLTGVSGDTYPLLVYIDADNKVQYAEMSGCFTASHVREMIDTYIVGNKPVEISDESICIAGGERAKLDILFYSQAKNGQFFTWESSNPSVATVDENGIVTGLQKGTTNITCKVNSDISFTCQVTVTIPDGLYKSDDGVWRYYVDGEVNTTYTGLVKYKTSWVYVINGELATSYTGLVKYKSSWVYIYKGKLNTTYTGLVKYKNSWVYVSKGKLDATYTGMAKYKTTWVYVTKGKLDPTYTGMARNAYGWWYMKNGKLDITYTGMAKNSYGWWHMTDGRLDLNYTGISSNAYGLWYVKNGKLDLTYSGEVMYNEVIRNVINGRVTK